MPRSPKKSKAGLPPDGERAQVGLAVPADQVDEQLARYRAMRDFGLSDEPAGATVPTPARRKSTLSGGLPFVIQKHAASHLHYDFRLGWAGVLKSWACAKGPSYVTADRRLAVQVEDHPLEYGGFEGTIPKGQYGGGTVMVWDQGTWWPQPGHENVDAGLRDGSLKFEMNGSRMKGKWTLVRMHARPADKGSRWGSSSKPNWLLIKEHDSFERPAGAPAITDEALTSVVTGRTMEQIAAETDHVWNSKETAGTGQAWYRKEPTPEDAAPVPRQVTPAKRARRGKPGANATRAEASKASPASAASEQEPQDGFKGKLEALPKEKQPTFLKPQLAQETLTPPDSAGWLHEIKLDGYRIQARKTGKSVALLTRSGLDWTQRVPAVAAAVARLPVGNATLDGEVVVLAEDGTTSFARLQASFQEGARNPLTYFCFDLLHLEGRSPRALPLRDRKELLAAVLMGTTGAADEVRFSEHLETGGDAMFRSACELGAEGIVSKRAASPYTAGRGGDWLKAKCLHEQEFVVGGFTLSSDGADRIGSLLLGYYDDGKLVYAGRAGTGFTQKTRAALRGELAKLERTRPPFATVPAEARRDALWTAPALVAQVRFASWTADQLLRQAAFLGLREDKAPAEVVREEPVTAPKRGRGQAGASVRKEAAPAKNRPTSSAPKRDGAAAANLRLTHPGKVLDPQSGLTKQQLADYYTAIAPRMLPHIAARPLSLVRCPEGAGKPCFYQKHVNHTLPPGVASVDVADKKTGKIEPYITLHTTEALAGLAQLGVLEVHPWGSCNDDLEHPDRLTFDLDPDEGLPWAAVCSAAAEVRTRLKKAGLTSFLKTTGGKGLHIVAPIEPRLTWAELKALAHTFVLSMERDAPALYLTRMTKAARRGKIYLDYLRNERGATAVAPFSPRARLGVNASVPLAWAALREPERPQFPVREFAAWGSRLGSDPWKALATTRQVLDPERFRRL